MSQDEWAKGEDAVDIDRSICKFFKFLCLFRVLTFFVFVSCYDLEGFS